MSTTWQGLYANGIAFGNNLNLSVNAWPETAGNNLTLTPYSDHTQVVTGASASGLICYLPALTVNAPNVNPQGLEFVIINNCAAGTMQVQDQSFNVLALLAPFQMVRVTCIDISSGTGKWVVGTPSTGFVPQTFAYAGNTLTYTSQSPSTITNWTYFLCPTSPAQVNAQLNPNSPSFIYFDNHNGQASGTNFAVGLPPLASLSLGQAFWLSCYSPSFSAPLQINSSPSDVGGSVNLGNINGINAYPGIIACCMVSAGTESGSRSWVLSFLNQT